MGETFAATSRDMNHILIESHSKWTCLRNATEQDDPGGIDGEQQGFGRYHESQSLEVGGSRCASPQAAKMSTVTLVSFGGVKC